MPCDVLFAQHRSTSSKQQKKKTKKAKLPPFSQLYFSFWCYKFTFRFVDVFRRTAEATFDDDGEVLSSTSFLANFWASLNSSLHVASHSPCFYDLWITSPFIFCCTCWSSFLNFSETYATTKTWLFFSDQSDELRREKLSLLTKFQKLLE